MAKMANIENKEVSNLKNEMASFKKWVPVIGILAVTICTLLLYRRFFFVVAFGEAIAMGVIAALFLAGKAKGPYHPFRRLIFFNLHFVCVMLGWVALFILLATYSSYQPLEVTWLSKKGFNVSLSLESLKHQSSFFIFLVSVAAFGITGQLAALIFYFSKKPGVPA